MSNILSFSSFASHYKHESDKNMTMREAYLRIKQTAGLPSIMRGQLRENKNECLQRIAEFWKTHIESIQIWHVTTSLYMDHFSTYGIAPCFPEALVETIQLISAVWKKHQQVIPLSVYFKLFEKRFEKVQQKNICISFLSSPACKFLNICCNKIGGVWKQEFQDFLDQAGAKKVCFSKQDEETILRIKELIHLIDIQAVMILTLNGGCSDIPQEFWNKYDLGDFCGSVDKFQEYVKSQCKDWNVSVRLNKYLEESLLPRLEVLLEKFRNQLSIPVNFPLLPDRVGIEIGSEYDSKRPKVEEENPTEEQLKIRCEWLNKFGRII